MSAQLLIRGAAVLAAIALLVAPFRSSAGLRAGLFVLAGVVLLVGSAWQKKWLFQVPGPRFLRIAVLAWVGWAAITVLIGTSPASAFASIRGDMLTPLLAAAVAYSVARGDTAQRWILAALAIGLFVLTAMAVTDPARAGIGNHEPHYVNVGWLSTWVVMLAALLPLARDAMARTTWPRVVNRGLWLIVVLLLGVGAWFSGNRVVWIAFGAMFAIYVWLDYRQARREAQASHVWLLLGAGVAVAVGMFMLASHMRAEQFPAADVNAVTILKQDDRQEIWRAAVKVIAERPLTGYGYRAPAADAALAAQFTEPGFGVVFRQAHNMVLNAGMQLGVLGMLTLLGLFVALLLVFWQAHARAPNDAARHAATAGLMLVTGFFLRNMTDDFFARHGALLFGALVGLLLARAYPERER
jgi:O-antigen ligase